GDAGGTRPVADLNDRRTGPVRRAAERGCGNEGREEEEVRVPAAVRPIQNLKLEWRGGGLHGELPGLKGEILVGTCRCEDQGQAQRHAARNTDRRDSRGCAEAAEALAAAQSEHGPSP